MDKQAFKQRMQNLKSYRENNPGKGYWDWKVEAFQDGGEVARKSLKDIRKESIVEDKLDYDVMLQNQNAYQKEFATNWYKERAKNPKYSSQLGGNKLDKILADIDKATWKNPTEAMRDNLTSQGYTPTDQNIKSQLQTINAKGTKGFAVPNMYSYYGAPRNTWHEGIGHIVGDNNPAILDSTPNINIPSNDPQYFDYVNQANEKHAQTWDFRGKNQTLKDDAGNYYIDPNRQLSSDDIQEMIDKGAAIPDQWKDLTTDVKDVYFKLGTEQKAYMNQLRTRMYNDKAISSLEEPVSTALIKKYMDSLGDKDSIKRAYKQHKSLSAYTKWFNSIPLLGIGAIGVNKYFNNGIEQEK